MSVPVDLQRLRLARSRSNYCRYTANGGGSQSVLVLPPVGYEFHLTYRLSHHLARSIALAGYRAVRLDWPGHGESPGPRGRYDGFARCLDEMLRELRECAGVVCLRFGAAIWLRYADEVASQLPSLAIDPLLTAARAIADVRRMRRISNIAIGSGAEGASSPYDDDERMLLACEPWPVKEFGRMSYVRRDGALYQLMDVVPEDAFRSGQTDEAVDASLLRALIDWLSRGLSERRVLT